jgi:hypothetical protein
VLPAHFGINLVPNRARAAFHGADDLLGVEVESLPFNEIRQHLAASLYLLPDSGPARTRGPRHIARRIPSMLLDKWIFQHLVRNRYGVQRYSPMPANEVDENQVSRTPRNPIPAPATTQEGGGHFFSGGTFIQDLGVVVDQDEFDFIVFVRSHGFSPNRLLTTRWVWRDRYSDH